MIALQSLEQRLESRPAGYCMYALVIPPKSAPRIISPMASWAIGRSSTLLCIFVVSLRLLQPSWWAKLGKSLGVPWGRAALISPLFCAVLTTTGLGGRCAR